nr:pyridoxamine 5'-phosphate oxidase family protein [uncultured Desulfobacter sp.]
MKANQLTTDQINALLAEAQVGHLATVSDNGFPYVTGKEFPSNMLAATGVIKIEVKECTGKFYDDSCQ